MLSAAKKRQHNLRKQPYLSTMYRYITEALYTGEDGSDQLLGTTWFAIVSLTSAEVRL